MLDVNLVRNSRSEYIKERIIDLTRDYPKFVRFFENDLNIVSNILKSMRAIKVNSFYIDAMRYFHRSMKVKHKIANAPKTPTPKNNEFDKHELERKKALIAKSDAERSIKKELAAKRLAENKLILDAAMAKKNARAQAIINKVEAEKSKKAKKASPPVVVPSPLNSETYQSQQRIISLTQ